MGAPERPYAIGHYHVGDGMTAAEAPAAIDRGALLRELRECYATIQELDHQWVALGDREVWQTGGRADELLSDLKAYSDRIVAIEGLLS